MAENTKEKGNTDEKLELFCDPCQLEDDHTVAVGYCEECNEYLCKTCNQVHRRLTATRDHVVTEQNELPAKSAIETKTDLPYKCLAHEDQELDHYCISHDELCCSTCLSKRHKNCKDVKNVADCLSDVDMQKEENDLKCKMHGLAVDLNNTMYLVKKSITAIENNYDVAEFDMLTAKHAAFEHIEDIYGTLNKKLCKTREEDLDKILPYKDKCEAVAFDMKTLESYFKEKKKCNKKQLFLTMKSAEVKIKSNRHELKEIKYNTHLNVTRYRFQPDSGIINMKTQPSSFGSMNVLQNVIKSTNQVSSLKAGNMDDPNVCSVTGIAVLSISRLVLVDRNNAFVKLVDTKQDIILSRVKFEPTPWDVTAISDNQIAVTVPDRKTVEFLSVFENKSLSILQAKKIKSEGKCYGITNDSDKITVIVRVDGLPAKLERYDLDGTLLLSVETDFQNPQYVISNADQTKMYTSDNFRERRITELSSADFMKLDTLRSCRDEVTGMAIDKTGVLYYCRNGEIDSVYIDEKQGIERKRVNLISGLSPYPKCLAFCNETNRLFVGKAGNDIGVYIVL